MKALKHLSAFLFVFAATLLLAACDYDGGSGSGKGNGSGGGIVGTWGDSEATEYWLFTFDSDGSYSCEVYDYFEKDYYTKEWGSYETDDNKLTLSWEDRLGDSGVSVGTYSTRGDELTIEWLDEYGNYDGYNKWTRFTDESVLGDSNDLLIGYWECRDGGHFYSYAFQSDGTYYYEYMFISSSGTINSVSEYGKYVYRKDIQMLYMDVTNTTRQLGEMEKTAECIISGNGSFRMGELIYKRK